MIELSPKALRFARLAAEEAFSGAADSEIADLKRKEADYLDAVRTGLLGHQYIQISDDLARFCLTSIKTLLDKQVDLDDSSWDENDRLYLEIISTYILDNLAVGLRA